MIYNFKELYKKMKKYDKKATNPFLNNPQTHNPTKGIYQQTYFWIENTTKEV